MHRSFYVLLGPDPALVKINGKHFYWVQFYKIKSSVPGLLQNTQGDWHWRHPNREAKPCSHEQLHWQRDKSSLILHSYWGPLAVEWWNSVQWWAGCRRTIQGTSTLCKVSSLALRVCLHLDIYQKQLLQLLFQNTYFGISACVPIRVSTWGFILE